MNIYVEIYNPIHNLQMCTGVPKKNGKRHAAEIGTMALDLLDCIRRLEIPHLPGTKFKLRIGCHCG